MAKKSRAVKRAATPAPLETSSVLADPLVSASEDESRGFLRVVWEERVAALMAVVIFLRPWIDGITFPWYNAYFLIAIVFIFALWAGRLLLGATSFRFRAPAALFAVLLLVALLTGWRSVQWHETYRTWLQWIGYFFLFVLATNGLRNRTGLNIVFGAFLITQTLEACWSLIHLKYALPATRAEVNANPALRQIYFQSVDLNPEIIHRLTVNRAYGSLLFPNALAAYLVLGIPFALGAIPGAFAALRNARSRERENTAPAGGSLMFPLAVSLVSWLALFVVTAAPLMWFLSQPPGALQPGTVTKTLWMSAAVLFPLFLGGAALSITRRKGFRAYVITVRAYALPVYLMLSGAALYYSFSRGGILALGASLAAGALLLALSGSEWARKLRTAAHILIVLGAVCALWPDGTGWAQPDGPRIDVQGVDLSLADMANTSSLRLRLGYWKAGLAMLRDYWLTGVGLGNFPTMYPVYQSLDAGDVKMAHNDYLQAFCEMGILGLLALLVFWGYFVLWNARRILGEADRNERLLLAGLFCSVLAFLVHSIVDFNFYNPSLAASAYFMAGAVYARAGLKFPEPPKTTAQQLLAVPLLALAAFVAGTSYRIQLANAEIVAKQAVGARMQAASYFSQQIHPQTFDPRVPPVVRLLEITPLIPSREDLERVGRIGVQMAENTPYRPLRPDEDVLGPVAQRYGWYAATDPVAARRLAARYISEWAQSLETSDAIYPHDPQIAHLIFQCQEHLLHLSETEADREKYIRAMETWARKCVERSPMQAPLRESLGRALLLRGSIERSSRSKALELYFQGLQEYRRAMELYPTSPDYALAYANALAEFARAYREAGDLENAAKYDAQAEEMREKSEWLRANRGFKP